MRVLPFSVILAAVAGHAVAQDVFLADSNEFRELIKQSAEISGAVVVGTGGGGRPRPDGLLAWLPAAWRGTSFCVGVISSDGLYEAINTYGVSETWQGGAVTIPYPTKKPEQLERRGPDELAVSIRQGNCGAEEAADQKDAIAYWAGTGDRGPSLLINAFRADDVYMYPLDDPAADAIYCKPLESPQRTAFDTICPLEPLLGSAAETIGLEIWRVRNREPDPAIEITLHAGGGSE